MRNLSRAILLGLALWLGAATVAEAQWTWSPQTRRFINLKRMPKETAELQMEHARTLFLQGQYRQALSETNKFDAFYRESDFSDDNQFLRAEIWQAQGSLMRAARGYQQVLSAYPDTNMYADAIARQYDIGDALYERGQEKMKKRFAFFRKRPLKQAIEVYGMVVDNQPFTSEAAEAQYKIGLCHFERREYVEAAFEYRRVVEDYAGSDWVDQAQHDLAITYYTMAQPADYDQTPSQLAIDQIDTFLTRLPDDPRAEDLRGKRAEMVEEIALQRLRAAQFYEKRREFDAARLYYGVVATKYAGTDAARQAEAWLAANGGPAEGIE
jgi:outer membrane protein assembly factor BamD